VGGDDIDDLFIEALVREDGHHRLVDADTVPEGLQLPGQVGLRTACEARHAAVAAALAALAVAAHAEGVDALAGNLLLRVGRGGDGQRKRREQSEQRRCGTNSGAVPERARVGVGRWGHQAGLGLA